MSVNPLKLGSKPYDHASQKHTGHVILNGAKHNRVRTGLTKVTTLIIFLVLAPDLVLCLSLKQLGKLQNQCN